MPPEGYYYKRPNLLAEDEIELAIAKSMRKGMGYGTKPSFLAMIQHRNEYQAEVDRLDKEIAEVEKLLGKGE